MLLRNIDVVSVIGPSHQMKLHCMIYLALSSLNLGSAPEWKDASPPRLRGPRGGAPRVPDTLPRRYNYSHNKKRYVRFVTANLYGHFSRAVL